MDTDTVKYTQEATELLKTLIAIPSVSRDEARAAEALCAFLASRDIAYERVANNIFCKGRDFRSSRPTLLLNAHIDTVKPTDSWTRNPFETAIEEGRLYGLGSNDCGGGLVSLLQAFRILSSKEQPYNIIYAVSAEEEVSGANGFTLMMPRLPRIDVAIVGEPTAMQPAVAEKGLMVLDITVHGAAGHAARDEGVNAIYKAIGQIEWLRSYRFPKLSPTLGQMKMTTTIINAGTLHNCIPDRCTYTVDIRTTDCYTNQEVLDIIASHLDADVRARSTRLGSSAISMEHPIVRRCINIGMKPFGSPTLSDQALMPWPSLKLGPGDSSRSHSADEYITTEEIGQAISTYVMLLDGLDISAAG